MPKMKNICRAVAVVSLVILSGCGKSVSGGGSPDARVIARINRFELTVADLKEGLDQGLRKKYPSRLSLEQKEKILEELIMKQVILQEAQKMNLDKEESFKKEIEGYWEQALIKSLVTKKLGECSSCLVVSEQEIADRYARMKRRVSAEIVAFGDERRAQTLSDAPAGFDKAKEDLKGGVIWGSPLGWYSAGDLPQEIEEIAFSLAPQGVSRPISYNGNWVIVRVAGEEPAQVEPVEELAPRITQDIIRKKREGLLRDLSAGLRKGASVKVDRDLLQSVDLN